MLKAWKRADTCPHNTHRALLPQLPTVALDRVGMFGTYTHIISLLHSLLYHGTYPSTMVSLVHIFLAVFVRQLAD